MRDPLREIFEIYEGRIGGHPMTEEERAIWDRAQMILGEDAIDEMVHAESRSLLETEYDFFREGFLLGARIMLELR